MTVAIAVFAWVGMWLFLLALGALVGGRYVAAVVLGVAGAAVAFTLLRVQQRRRWAIAVAASVLVVMAFGPLVTADRFTAGRAVISAVMVAGAVMLVRSVAREDLRAPA